MLTATVMAEIAGRQRPIHPSDTEQDRQSGEHLQFKGIAAGLQRALRAGAWYTRRALCIAYNAIARERERNAYRRALQALNVWTLKDIGLHRGEIPWALNGLSAADKLSRLSAWSVQD